jgi:putative endonuclease
MAKHNELGITGEDIAVNYLISKGYSILERNWRSGHKEIDIVASIGTELVVVEVKTRRGNDYGNPEDAVNNKKIKRIVMATDAYLKFKQIDANVRFDVVTVLFNHTGKYEVKHLEDAFFAPMW